MQSQFSTVEEALNQLVNGGYIILADNEDRENEGDLVALGENVNADTIYEMLNEANGLMCVPVSEGIAKHLAFKPMVEHSTDPHQTPFMVTTDGTLEATGVTTGVSAFDRAATIDHQPTTGELGVVVRKKYWRNGIGRLLVDEAEYWFNTYSSLENLVLTVFEDNIPAIKLYQQLHFVATGKTVEQGRNVLQMQYDNKKEETMER